MKQITIGLNQLNQEAIAKFESSGTLGLEAQNETIELTLEDVEIQTEDIPGWTVATEGQMTIALDINVTEELKQEGIAREFINKIQNLRKENNYEVTDRIHVEILKHPEFNDAVLNHKNYICTQTLAKGLELVESIADSEAKEVEIDADVKTHILIRRL